MRRKSYYSSFSSVSDRCRRALTSSFSSVSVRCRRAFSFKRRLTDTCVLGNLPKIGTGFGKVHANLREIPEGDEKYSRYRSLFFYHSRMTATTSSFSSVSVRCRRAFSFKRRLTDTYDLGNLPKVGTGFVGIHGRLREIPEGDEKYSRYRSLFFYHSRMTATTSSFSSVSVRCRRAFSFKRRLTDHLRPRESP